MAYGFSSVLFDMTLSIVLCFIVSLGDGDVIVTLKIGIHESTTINRFSEQYIAGSGNSTQVGCYMQVKKRWMH